MAEIPSVPGLTDDEQDNLASLLNQLSSKTPRNRRRSAYYDGKNAVRDLGISMPPNLQRVAMVLGWSAKAVDILSRRCNLEGFYIPGIRDQASVGLDLLWDDNQLDLESAMAGTSSLIHATAFLVVSAGDETAGEPPVLITGRDALSSTGLWDRRARRLKAFLSIISTDEAGQPTDMVMYQPGLVTTMQRDSAARGGWTLDRQGHQYGMPVQPLPYKPSLVRPFGSSRISRAVMSLHDSAVRTMMRSEITGELYSVPQRVLLGVDEAAFMGADGQRRSMWQSLLGRIWAVDRDDEGNLPEVKEYAAAPQTPHVEQMRTWAALFAGETSIPVTSLGINSDANPASAAAYEASREDLIQEAEGATNAWSPAWRRSMMTALSMLNGWQTPPDQFRGLQPRWRSPATPTRAAAADAAAKTLDKFPWLSDTELGLELYGFDRSFITRAMAERQRQQGRQLLDRISAGQSLVPDDLGELTPAETTPTPAE